MVLSWQSQVAEISAAGSFECGRERDAFVLVLDILKYYMGRVFYLVHCPGLLGKEWCYQN